MVSIRGSGRFLALVMAVTIMACARLEPVREPPNGDGPGRSEASSVVIQIENQNTGQATIYIVEDRGMPVRVGEVPPLSQRFFERRLWGTRSVQFDVRLLAGRTYRTDSIVATPGDTIYLTVPSRM